MRLRQKLLNAADTFNKVAVRQGVGETNEARWAERFAGHHSNLDLFEDQVGKLSRRCGDLATDFATQNALVPAILRPITPSTEG